MKLYIDKENLLSFISSAGNMTDPDLFSDCRRMINRHMSVCYNFTKAEVRNEPRLMSWFSGFATHGCGKGSSSVFLAEKCPPRPVKCNYFNNVRRDDKCAVYLIDEDVSKICSSHTVLAGGVGDEISVLRKLMCDDDYKFHKLYNIRKKENFSGWSQLDTDGHVLPTTDILIVDRYIFGDYRGIQESLLENNLYRILEMFGAKGGDRINVVFLTSGNTETKLWENRRMRIKECLKTSNKYAKVNVTFIFYPAHYHEDVVREHDRLIITNYRLFRSGDSFSYYDSKGELISKGEFLDVDSPAESEKSDMVESILDSLQKTYNAIKNIRNDDLIIGDKESSYIDF